MTDFDPESVPVRPAATVMLVDDRPDLQVYMLQRNANTVFAGGMWVFPGGAVDHQDDASYYKDIVTHRSDNEASELMELKSVKYYLLSYRQVGIVQEHAANKILKDLVALCEPRKMSLTLDYNVRGGLHTEITVEYHQ